MCSTQIRASWAEGKSKTESDKVKVNNVGMEVAFLITVEVQIGSLHHLVD